MRRFAAVATTVLLVLAMTVGTAYANVCIGSACGDAMLRPSVASESCLTDAGQSTRHFSCNHTVQAEPRDNATLAQSGHDTFVSAARATVVPPALSLVGLPREVQASDARGAPHLSVVIRI
jgi:hypothetical protein